MEFMPTKTAAAKWEISAKKVTLLCSQGKIAGAKKVGGAWMIPLQAPNPLPASSSLSQNAKPFLKWAGGKNALLTQIQTFYPFDQTITKYAEPFVGGGAVLFDILNKYDLEQVYIGDINPELINAYLCIRSHADEMINRLAALQEHFWPLHPQERKMDYLLKRQRYNDLIEMGQERTRVEKAALMIFLNKTCFNGLYRVNKKGQFNVPMGTYKMPLICDEANLLAVSKKLQNVTILQGDYTLSADFIDSHTFVYFDPPYRPISKTAHFTSYTEESFNDAKQRELSEFVRQCSQRGAKCLLSNSDPKNTNPEDTFFDDLYHDFTISRTAVTRMISCKSQSRGKIHELLIRNF